MALLSPSIATPSKLTSHRRAHVFAPQQPPRSAILCFSVAGGRLSYRRRPLPLTGTGTCHLDRFKWAAPAGWQCLAVCSYLGVYQGVPRPASQVPSPSSCPSLLISVYSRISPHHHHQHHWQQRFKEGERMKDPSSPVTSHPHPIPDLDNSTVSKRPTRSLQARGRRAATLANPILFYLL